MLTGIVPVLTKGSFATFYGGEIVIREIEERNKVELQPSQVIPSFFIISSLFQMMMYVYKRIRTSGYRNIQSYISLLKKNLGRLISISAQVINQLGQLRRVEPLRCCCPHHYFYPKLLCRYVPLRRYRGRGLQPSSSWKGAISLHCSK